MRVTREENEDAEKTVITTEASYPPMTTTEDSDWLTHPPEFEVRQDQCY